MDAPDGQVPAPRRPGLPRLRRAADTSAPRAAAPAADAPRVADLSALLGDIDALRRTLQTDLSLAAAALEEGAEELAAELVEGDLVEVRSFADRAYDRLAHLDGEAGERLEEQPVVAPLRRRRILSAAPLMAAAAALIGFAAFSPGATPSTGSSLTSAAIAGYELNRLALQGAPDEELRLAAEELNDELAELIAHAAEDPAAAQQALMLLEQTTEVLASQGDSGVLRDVMAQTQALRERLREALPDAVKRPARPVVRPAPPDLPRVQDRQKERSGSSESPKSSTKPAASPKASPTTAPTTAPTSAPTSAPEPPPADEPAPRSSERPSGSLPDGEDVPGF